MLQREIRLLAAVPLLVAPEKSDVIVMKNGEDALIDSSSTRSNYL
jgi:hypothetical protein